jgi:excisionase family DNA binding protein
MNLDNKLKNLPEVLTIREVAKLFNISLMTLRRWDKEGKLKAFRPSLMNKRRYKKSDIIKFLNSYPKEKTQKRKK